MKSTSFGCIETQNITAPSGQNADAQVVIFHPDDVHAVERPVVGDGAFASWEKGWWNHAFKCFVLLF
ncbi:MAG: hypothetical protein IPN76_31745 [Saprospiraceae bacterium]|nr:hypothetical protein [Saprospiraceae bacterium]